jgi:thioredoxin reductase (NADPH)
MLRSASFSSVVVVGGGDSALDWALGLEPVARSVTLVHRRDAFRAHAHSVKLLRDSTVSLCIPAQVVGISGGDRVEAVSVRNTETKQVTELPAQEVVAALGFTADITPLEAWGLNVEERHIVVDTTMATNLPRVFAAGDITEYPGKVRLISVGFGEVATAVCNAATVIDPEATVFPGHSTEQQGEGPPA